MSINTAITTATPIVYPESEGKPMGETDVHSEAKLKEIAVRAGVTLEELQGISPSDKRTN